MSIAALILGESGTGKSTSLENLDPKETFIINVLGKPLPFREFKKHYVPIKDWQDTTGNYYETDDYAKIINCINYVDLKRSDIKNLIIDDWQYTMCNEFMNRAMEKGYEKFTEMALHAWAIAQKMIHSRADLFCFILSHSDMDMNGTYKCKTIGKLLDEKIDVDGMFTTVLHTQVMDGAYRFLTQHDGRHKAKSPKGMFEERYINNDLAFVKNKMNNYFNGDISL